MTCKELAEKVGALGTIISPETIRKDWAKGAPRGSAEGYLRWREKNIRKGDPEARDLKAEKLRKEIELLTERHLGEKRSNEIESGELVRIEEVHAKLAQCVARARAVIVSKFETELPPRQDGMPAERIAELNRAALDEVFAILGRKETYV